jgi:hypothetical protein
MLHSLIVLAGVPEAYISPVSYVRFPTSCGNACPCVHVSDAASVYSEDCPGCSTGSVFGDTNTGSEYTASVN